MSANAGLISRLVVAVTMSKWLPHGRSGGLHVREHHSNPRVAGIDQHRKARVALQQLMQQPKLLGRKAGIHGGDAGDVAAGPIEAGDEAGHRVGAGDEHDRNCRGRGLGSQRRRHAAWGRDDAHSPAYQLGRQLG